MSSTINDSRTKYFHCGKSGHIVRNCYKKNTDETRQKQKRYTWHFANKNQNHDLKLFSIDSSLFVEIDEVKTWFVDSRDSTHMIGNKH